ncbi:DUF6281 family protein [Streptomyces sp. NPDC050504]|uniref:DUF6281 family protein n=1 Tax=Streptomyces sp. NPDC050504 TaxID=3365618 RepID=UPI0037A464EB
MGRAERSAALVVAAMVAAVGCTADGNSGAGGESSCVFEVHYQGRAYRDVANVEFTVGAKLGDATKPPCDDTGGRGDDGEAETETAYAVKGLAPEVALAVGTAPDDVVFVALHAGKGKGVPPEVQKLIDSQK